MDLKKNRTEIQNLWSKLQSGQEVVNIREKTEGRLISRVLTFKKVLNGAFLSSCNRFPKTGIPGGPGGKRECLRAFKLKIHKTTRISVVISNMTVNSMMWVRTGYSKTKTTAVFTVYCCSA